MAQHRTDPHLLLFKSEAFPLRCSWLPCRWLHLRDDVHEHIGWQRGEHATTRDDLAHKETLPLARKKVGAVGQGHERRLRAEGVMRIPRKPRGAVAIMMDPRCGGLVGDRCERIGARRADRKVVCDVVHRLSARSRQAKRPHFEPRHRTRHLAKKAKTDKDRKKMNTRRVVLVTFYFELCDSYRLYAFLPHCAMVLWEEAQRTGQSHRAIDAACFLVAQKMMDTSVFKIGDIADVFSAREDDVREGEKQIFLSSFALRLRPDRGLFARLSTIDPSLHEHVKRFFNLALIGTRQDCAPLAFVRRLTFSPTRPRSQSHRSRV